jgi:hypothetical protein
MTKIRLGKQFDDSRSQYDIKLGGGGDLDLRAGDLHDRSKTKLSLEQTAGTEKKPNSTLSLMLYTVIIISILGVVYAISLSASAGMFAAIILSGAVLTLLICLLDLRKSGEIGEENFVRLVVKSLKSLSGLSPR